MSASTGVVPRIALGCLSLLVGVLLVQALLVIPAASAALWARHYRAQLVIATLIGAASGALGLIVAFQFDIAAGGSIVLVATAIFAVSVIMQRGQ